MQHHILIIDKGISGRTLLEEFLADSGLNFIITHSMKFRSEDLLSLQPKPNIAIIDEDAVAMPVQEIISIIKKEISDHTPVLVISSQGGQLTKGETDFNDAFCFFTKPLIKHEFISVIMKAAELNEFYDGINEKIGKIKKDFYHIEELLLNLGNFPFAFMIIKPTGRIEWANEGFKGIHGISLDEYRASYGNTVFSLPLTSETAGLFNQCLRERQPAQGIYKIKTGTGESKWLQLYFTPVLNSSGNVEKIVAIETDITPFKRKEEELNIQNEKIQEIAKNFESANSLLEMQKQEINQQKQTIEEEQQKSEKLLLNILPFEVARQLKTKGRAGTRQYKLVSVLFADFKGFSNISKTLDPKDLVSILDSYFATFDEITARHYIEKIKTIGDAYMCAGGLPLSNKSNPVDAVLAGLEIQHYMNTLNDTKVLSNLPVWELRLGIHTGPVVAGVVGKKRLAYDIWGDTVNIASRMEQSGCVGMVNISGNTYEYVRDFFDCNYRGKVETKNLGKIDMYFVNRIKPEYSLDKLGILPNEVMINMVNKL
jgi:PAS domain S-box-containing protein